MYSTVGVVMRRAPRGAPVRAGADAAPATADPVSATAAAVVAAEAARKFLLLITGAPHVETMNRFTAVNVGACGMEVNECAGFSCLGAGC